MYRLFNKKTRTAALNDYAEGAITGAILGIIGGAFYQIGKKLNNSLFRKEDKDE